MKQYFSTLITLVLMALACGIFSLIVLGPWILAFSWPKTEPMLFVSAAALWIALPIMVLDVWREEI